MDFPPHRMTQRGVHHSVALEGGFSLEFRAHNGGLEVHAVGAAHFDIRTGQSSTYHLLYS